MLEDRIAAALSAAMCRNDAALLVAFSGGLDSTVLLHALTALRGNRCVRAAHINHGLSDDAAAWAAHCQAQCDRLGVALKIVNVKIEPGGEGGLEAQAREARYAALARELRSGEHLVTAHHQQDQLETVLLALLRGSGVHGLAAMPAVLQRQGITLLRPLLEINRDEVLAAALAENLSWIDDPSNGDERFDRNFLRHKIVPLLETRWPAAAKAASRSARLSAEAMCVIDELAAHDIGEALRDNCLVVDALHDLSRTRQQNALRWVCRKLALPMPSELQLREAIAALLSERADAEPLAAWPGVRIRRYRNTIWLYSAQADPGACAAQTDAQQWNPQTVLDLGPVRGRLCLARCDGQAIAEQQLPDRLRVVFRAGGERLRPGPRARQRDLKKLLQERGVLPWMRRHIPLIYANDELLAVGDLWLNADHPAVVSDGGQVIQWCGHAPLQAPD